MDRKVIVGTRGSKLALWQAHNLQEKLSQINVASRLEIISTKGDRIQDIGFDKLEGKGFFTKEIEDALLDKKIDIAVHSLKDLQTTQPDGLLLGALSERANPADLLIIKKSAVNSSKTLSLKDRPKIGTSSIRRQLFIKNLVTDADIRPLRGNVPTRLDKLSKEDYDAIILAHAGIDRLELSLDNYHCITLHTREFVPAPGQGVIGYQCRASDKEIRRILSKIHHTASALCTNIERKVLQLYDGGCHIALGVHVERDAAGNYHGYAAYSPDELSPLSRAVISQSTTNNMAERLFDKLNS